MMSQRAAYVKRMSSLPCCGAERGGEVWGAVEAPQWPSTVGGRPCWRRRPAPEVTNIYVLRDPTNRGVVLTQLVSGLSATLLPVQGFSISGAAAGRNVPIPPNVTAGLSAPAGAQHTAGSAEASGLCGGQPGLNRPPALSASRPVCARGDRKESGRQR